MSWVRGRRGELVPVPSFGTTFEADQPTLCAPCLDRIKYTDTGDLRCFFLGRLGPCPYEAPPSDFEVITGLPLEDWMAVRTHEQLTELVAAHPYPGAPSPAQAPVPVGSPS